MRWVFDTNRSMCPSGTDLDTSAAPIVPPAPGRLSSTSGLPHNSCSFGPSARAGTSTAPPGENGMMACTARVDALQRGGSGHVVVRRGSDWNPPWRERDHRPVATACPDALEVHQRQSQPPGRSRAKHELFAIEVVADHDGVVPHRRESE